VSRLREVWITSAEQVVALAATAGGITSLTSHLRTTEDRARELVDRARAALDPQRLRELDTPVDTREYGLGVLPPSEPEDGSHRES
jgi:hypothetical protein